jgi:thiol:disulfide interchange protein DsbD
LLIGLNGKPLGELDAFLPPPNYNELMSTKESGSTTAGTSNSTSAKSISASEEELIWMDNYQDALKLAKEKKKMIFIDFTGYTCTNCRWMELNMFSKKEIRSYLENMILVRLYTDRRNEPYQSNKNFQKNRFNSIELPLYVIYTPEEKLIGTKAFTRDVTEFLGFLKKGADYKL